MVVKDNGMGRAKRVRKARMKNRLHRKIWRRTCRNEKFCEALRSEEVAKWGEDHYIVKYLDKQIAIHSPRKVTQSRPTPRAG